MKKTRKREQNHCEQRILNEIPLSGAYRFRAEIVDLDPKAYLVRREGESGDRKGNIVKWQKNLGFSTTNQNKLRRCQKRLSHSLN